MEVLRDIIGDWKIGVIIGLLYGSAALFFHPSADSRMILIFFPLYLVDIFFYLPLSLFISNPNIQQMLIPVSGIIVGLVGIDIWKGIDGLCRKQQNGILWQKGLFFGFVYGLCAVIWFLIPFVFENSRWMINTFGMFLFAPVTLPSLVISDPFSGGFTMNIFFYPLLIINGIMIGSIFGYLITPGKSVIKKPADARPHDQKIRIAIMIISVILLVLLMVFSGLVQSDRFFAPSCDSSIGRITLLTTMPPGPTNMTFYKITPRDTDIVQTEEEDSGYPPENIPSEAEAPKFAEKILEKYGGLPLDAHLGKVQTEYDDYGKGSKKYPDAVFVEYTRLIDRYQVVGGNGGLLILKIGEDGKPLWIRKNWETIVPAGKMDIIPASDAFEKLKNGEFIENRPKESDDYFVKSIGPAYYYFNEGENQTYLKPVWLFGGSHPDGSGFLIPIDARVS